MLAQILTSEQKPFVPFDGKQKQELYKKISQELLRDLQKGDIRDHYTNALIDDWTTKMQMLDHFKEDRGEGSIGWSGYTDEEWDNVTKTLEEEMGLVHKVRKLFEVMEDLDDKLRIQRTNDLNHVSTKMNLSHETPIDPKHGPEWDAGKTSAVLTIAGTAASVAPPLAPPLGLRY